MTEETRVKPWMVGLGSGLLAFAQGAIHLRDAHSLGDSGELATVVATLGVAHPPGYPLYTMLGHGVVQAFGLVGLSPLLAVNFFSLLAMSMAAGFFGGTVAMASNAAGLPRRACLLFVLAGLLAWIGNPVVLASSVIAEVYMMHLALIAATICLLAAKVYGERTEPSPAWVFVLGIVTGLGVSHHLTYALLVPCSLCVALGLALPYRQRVGRVAGYLAAGVAGTAVGLLPYVYTFFRSRMNPTMNWGRPGDSWASFWRHISARQYQGILGQTHNQEYAYTLLERLCLGLIPILVLIGLAMLLLRFYATRSTLHDLRRWEIVFPGLLLLYAAMVFAFNMSYSIYDIIDYFPPLWYLAGLLYILFWMGALGLAPSAGKPRLPGLSAVPVPAAPTRDPAPGDMRLLGVLMLVLAGLAVAGHREAAGLLGAQRRETRLVADPFLSLPNEPGMVAINDDSIGIIQYLQLVERRNTNLTVFHPQFLLLHPSYMGPVLDAAGMERVMLYDEREHPDAAKFLANPATVGRTILRNIEERSPVPLYLLDAKTRRFLKRADAPAEDYMARLVADGFLPPPTDEVQFRPKVATLTAYLEWRKTNAPATPPGSPGAGESE